MAIKKAYLRFFSRSRARARGYTRDPLSAVQLVAQATRKAGRNKGFFRDLWDDFGALLRFVRAWGKGDYRRVPQKSIILGIAALIYFLSPLDAIPDVIPLVGFVDDATILAFVVNAIRSDLEEFRRWEVRGDENVTVIDAEAS